MSEQTEKTTQQAEEVELALGDKKLKVRGSDVITTFIGMVMVGGLVFLWTEIGAHAKDADKGADKIAAVLKDVAEAQREQVKATRVTNCMLSIEQKDRQRQLETCERLSR